jgi:hypothetical protein
LSTGAAGLLAAERAEQLRIDRDDFARSFKAAVAEGAVALLRFPSDAEIDGRPMLEWCESHARQHTRLMVAKCDIQPTWALDQASIVAHILEQLGEHLPPCSDELAIQRLQRHASALSGGLVTIFVVGGAYDGDLLEPIIEAVVLRPAPSMARVVLLLAPAAAGPVSVAGHTAIVCEGSPFAKDDVISHLRKCWGLAATDGEQIYSSMERLGVANQPARVYEYIRLHCGRSTA